MYRNRILARVTVGALILGLPALVVAGAANESKEGQTAKPMKEGSCAKTMTNVFTPKLQKVNSFIGTTLENTKGENLGKIEDVVLNSNRDRVAYAVVALGGTAGMGEKWYAVPWSCLELKNEGKTCVLNIDKDRLAQAPSFTRHKWPDMNDPQWAHEVHQFFSSTGGTVKMMEHHAGEYGHAEAQGMHERMGAAGSEHLWGVRHSRLIGTDVKNRQDEKLGDIEDIVIDTHKGDVAFGILSFGGVLGIGEKYAAVPWSAIELRPALRIARLDTDRKTLEAIAFKPSLWPNLSDPTYARSIYSRFDREPYWEVFGYVGSGMRERPEEAWLSGSAYNKCFNTRSIETVEGTVDSVGTFHPERGAAAGLRLRVKTDAGNMVTIYAGPEGYVSRNGWTFHSGDRISVTGSKTEVQNRSVLMACEIQRSGQKLELRDRQGQPKWTAEDLRMR